jgi:16S rRNA (guanine(527)-N(7))-methyltransferase RsmG
MPDLRIQTVLPSMGIDSRSPEGEKILRYVEIIAKWNRRLNLVSSTRKEVLIQLVQEAIWAARRYPSGSRVHLDIGSGAGFPAIPLAVLRPDVDITMVESREKKAAFLQTAVYELGLTNACVANERLQDTLCRSPTPSAWECVSWKAVVVSSKDFRSLLEIAGEGLRLWLFHGKDLPVEEPELVAGSLELIRREECPFHPGWFLSEFHRRSVSRETG